MLLNLNAWKKDWERETGFSAQLMALGVFKIINEEIHIKMYNVWYKILNNEIVDYLLVIVLN